jgi:hypothetical protein
MIQSKTDTSDLITPFNNPYEAQDQLMVIVVSLNMRF